jgi:hypothetical protein
MRRGEFDDKGGSSYVETQGTNLKPVNCLRMLQNSYFVIICYLCDLKLARSVRNRTIIATPKEGTTIFILLG